MSGAPPTPRTRGMLSQHILLTEVTPAKKIIERLNHIPNSAFNESEFALSERGREGSLNKLRRQEEIKKALQKKTGFMRRLFQGGKRTRKYKKKLTISPKVVEAVTNVLELVEVVGGGKTRRKAKKFTRRH
jgi:hypothetical protein